MKVFFLLRCPQPGVGADLLSAPKSTHLRLVQVNHQGRSTPPATGYKRPTHSAAPGQNALCMVSLAPLGTAVLLLGSGVWCLLYFFSFLLFVVQHFSQPTCLKHSIFNLRRCSSVCVVGPLTSPNEHQADEELVV